MLGGTAGRTKTNVNDISKTFATVDIFFEQNPTKLYTD